MAIGEEEWNAHALLIGQVMLAWSRTTYQLLRVFTHLTGSGAPLAETLYFSHASDSAQRKLLRSVAEAVNLPPTPDAELKALLRRIENVAAARNVAAHSIFGITLFDEESGAWGPRVVPVLGQHVDRRRKDDVEQQLRGAAAELESIFSGLDNWLATTAFPERLWGQPPFVGGVSPLGAPSAER